MHQKLRPSRKISTRKIDKQLQFLQGILSRTVTFRCPGSRICKHNLASYKISWFKINQSFEKLLSCVILKLKNLLTNPFYPFQKAYMRENHTNNFV